MRSKTLFRAFSAFTAMVLVFASAAVPAYAQDGDYSLGAAHREFVESSRSGTSSGHTVSSQFRESQAGAPSGFMDRLRQGWEDLSSSFRFRPRDTDSGTSGGGNIVDDMSPSIVGTGIGQGQDALANSMTSLGRRQPSQYQAAGNRLQQAGESLRSNGYITRTVDTINTVDTIRTFTDTGHTHPSMVWTHYSFKAGGLLTSNIGAASAAAPTVGAVGDFVGGNVCTNYMNSHTSDALEMADGMTEYADNITYKMMTNTFTPSDIAGPGPDGSQGALTRPLPNSGIQGGLMSDIWNFTKIMFNSPAHALNWIITGGKPDNTSSDPGDLSVWSNLWNNICDGWNSIFGNKKKTGPGDTKSYFNHRSGSGWILLCNECAKEGLDGSNCPHVNWGE